MFKKFMLSAVAAAALAGVCSTAQAQGVLVPVEIEGRLSAANMQTNTGTLTVMNNTVLVTEQTELVSPTGSRSTILKAGGTPLFNARSWILGASFNGRSTSPGLLGGTVIVTGELDTATGLITASEVFSDVAENVVLGVISAANCTTVTCQGPNDWIRGNGPTGPVFIANRNQRLRAGVISDAGLFEINALLGSLVGTPEVPTTFGGEGYFSDDKIFPLAADAPKTEQALVYWAFELGENRPDLIRRPNVPEISSLRIRCTEGDRIEVRGFVHTPVLADGTVRVLANQPTGAGQGFIRAEMDVNGDGIIQPATERFDSDAPTPDVPASYGVYRLRADIDQCGASANVYWMRPAGTTAWASVLDVPVDRLREE
jgi:hypothetical protein